MITAQSIIQQAQTTLQDPEGTRWPAAELVAYLNRGQRDIQNVRPDSTAVLTTVELVPGFKQTLPADAALLIDIPSNHTGWPITKVDQVILDASAPGWRACVGSTAIAHFMHDPRNPRIYLVYPPANDLSAVMLEYSSYPDDVAVPAGVTWESVAGNIFLPDQFATPLMLLVLAYAYAKDAEFGGNAELANSYRQQAAALLGAELQSGALVAPKS